MCCYKCENITDKSAVLSHLDAVINFELAPPIETAVKRMVEIGTG